MVAGRFWLFCFLGATKEQPKIIGGGIAAGQPQIGPGSWLIYDI